MSAMERIDLVARFRELASEIAERDFSGIGEDTLIADLGLDSLSTLELVGCFERELDLYVPSEELADVTHVRDLLSLLRGKLGQRAA